MVNSCIEVVPKAPPSVRTDTNNTSRSLVMAPCRTHPLTGWLKARIVAVMTLAPAAPETEGFFAEVNPYITPQEMSQRTGLSPRTMLRGLQEHRIQPRVRKELELTHISPPNGNSKPRDIAEGRMLSTIC